MKYKIIITFFLTFYLAVADAQPPVVVVSDFEDRSGQGLNLGRKVREEITDLLVSMPHVQIVERLRMDKIIEEMSFSQSAFVDASTAAEFGKMAGADLVIFGSVADASYNKVTRDRFSLTEGKHQARLGSSQVNINVQIVDVGTNQTIFSRSKLGTATGEPDKGAVIPLAATNAVEEMAVDLQAQFPIKGYVIKKDKTDRGYIVYFDVGSNYGIEEGRDMLIYGKGETLVHPVTNEVLSSSKGKLLGKAKVVEVSETFSIATVKKKEFRRIEVALPFEAAPVGKSAMKEVSGVLKIFGIE